MDSAPKSIPSLLTFHIQCRWIGFLWPPLSFSGKKLHRFFGAPWEKTQHAHSSRKFCIGLHIFYMQIVRNLVMLQCDSALGSVLSTIYIYNGAMKATTDLIPTNPERTTWLIMGSVTTVPLLHPSPPFVFTHHCRPHFLPLPSSHNRD